MRIIIFIILFFIVGAGIYFVFNFDAVIGVITNFICNLVC